MNHVAARRTSTATGPEIDVSVYFGEPYQEVVLLNHIAKMLGEKALQPV